MQPITSSEPPLIRFSHRQSYPPFLAPALTCHLMVRHGDDLTLEENVAAEDASDHERKLRVRRGLDQSIQTRVQAINELLHKIDPKNVAGKHGGRFLEPEPANTSKASHPTCDWRETLCLTVDKPFGCFSISVIVELNSEYVAISLRASPLSDAEKSGDPDAVHRTSGAAKAIACLATHDLRPDHSTDPDVLTADKAISQLFGGFWDDYFCTIAGASAPQTAESARDLVFGALGERRGEFQGIILRAPIEREIEKPPGGTNTPAKIDTAEARRDQDATHLRDLLNDARPIQTQEVEYGDSSGPLIQIPSDDSLRHIKDRVRAFVNDRPSFFSRLLGFRNPPRRAFNPGNAVLSFIFDGLAVHGSTLGGDDERVTRYFIVYGGPSRHQLGRLVMALHHCGEMRLAGFFEYDKLDVASHRIRILDRRLGPDHSKHHGDLAAFNAELNDIAQRTCRGGLAFRIARTSHYADIVESLVRDLRVKRIEGWQTYDGFIRRNILRRLREASGIGIRFDAVLRRMRQLEAAASTMNLVRQQHELVKLQSIADVLTMAAVAYYLGSMLGAAIASTSYSQITVQLACSLLVCGAHVAHVGAPTLEETLELQHLHNSVAHVLGYAAGIAITIFVRGLFEIAAWLGDKNRRNRA